MADILISNSENINNIQLKDQVVVPTTPSSGFKRLYVKANSLYFVDSSGVEHEIMEIGDLNANQTIDHSTITLTAGNGLSGGGTIAANRTFDLDLNELTTEASPATGDYIPIVDISESNATNKATIASILALVTAGASITSGSFTGNGTSQNITGVGFNPKFVIIHNTANSPIWKWTSMGGTNSGFPSAGGLITTGITGLITDGFSVGSSVYANSNTVTHYWLAIG